MRVGRSGVWRSQGDDADQLNLAVLPNFSSASNTNNYESDSRALCHLRSAYGGATSDESNLLCLSVTLTLGPTRFSEGSPLRSHEPSSATNGNLMCPSGVSYHSISTQAHGSGSVTNSFISSNQHILYSSRKRQKSDRLITKAFLSQGLGCVARNQPLIIQRRMLRLEYPVNFSISLNEYSRSLPSTIIVFLALHYISSAEFCIGLHQGYSLRL